MKIRHIKDSDLQKLAGSVFGDSLQEYGGLQSPDLFGARPPRNRDEAKSAQPTEHMRGYIALNKPCINFVKTRAGAALLCKILGLDKKTREGFLNFRLGVEISSGEIVELGTVGKLPSKHYYLGPEALLYFVDNFDIEKAIREELKELLAFDDINSITMTPNDFPIIGKYYVNKSNNNQYSTSSSTSSTNQSATSSEEEPYWAEILSNSIINSEERICLLVNLKSKEDLYNMFFHNLIVLPMSYRPKIDQRQDPLTKMYSRIVVINGDMKQMISGGVTVGEMKETYRNLQSAVTNVTYKNLGRRSIKDAGSIAERLTGKKGYIRNLMQGKRQDFSGRSVITINPTLGIDQCGIPEDMLPKLLQYHILKHLEDKDLSTIKSVIGKGAQSHKACLEFIKKERLLEKIPFLLNRAPSLHNLSIQALWAVPTKSRSIEINPLIVEAYNADFDGDQMAVHVPCHYKAVEEASILMSPLYNPFNPVTGEVIIKPRHEILLGLNICTKEHPSKTPSTVAFPGSMEELRRQVISHEIKVYDIITSSPANQANASHITAGVLSVMACLPKDLWHLVREISGKTIDELAEPLAEAGQTIFRDSTNALVELGFAVATLYSPTLNLTNTENIEQLKEPFLEYNRKLDIYIELYNDGFMDDEEYNRKFNKESTLASTEVSNRIKAGAISPDDCFSQLVSSGARGKINNLVQIYAHKGVVNKNSREAFPVMIENSFLDGLTPLEHFMTAFSARTDTMARAKKTADTGYASRLMCHTASEILIRQEDCGTTDGLEISKMYLSDQLRLEDPAEKERKVKYYFQDIISGRYEAGTNIYISDDLAKQWAESRDSVTIRSVLTCDDSCCAMCYGKDIGHRSTNVVVGHPVGMIAAQGIGGLGTQLSMDTFQQGGVASQKGIASDFDRINALLNMSDITKMPDRFPLYDPLAWADGVITSTRISATKQRVQIDGSKRAKVLPIEVELKKQVSRGESISLVRGDLNIHEVLQYRGIEEAQKQLTFSMYLTYRDKEAIDLKHFECLAAGMTLYLVMHSEKGLLDSGKYYLKSEINDALQMGDDITAVARLKGLKETRVLHAGLVSNFELENVVKGLSRAVVTGNKDSCKTPIASILMGHKPFVGETINPNYIRERQAQFHS